MAVGLSALIYVFILAFRSSCLRRCIKAWKFSREITKPIQLQMIGKNPKTKNEIIKLGIEKRNTNLVAKSLVSPTN